MKIEFKLKFIINLLFLMIQLITFDKQFVQTNDEFRRESNKPQKFEDNYYPLSEQTSKKSSHIITNFKSKLKKPKNKPKNKFKDKPKKSGKVRAIQSDALKQEIILGQQVISLGPRIPFLTIGNTSISSHKFTLSAPNCGLYSSKFIVERIVNGYKADKGSQPWITGVIVGDYHWCSAIIINEYWLISAAHAFERNDPSLYTIRVGHIDRTLGTDYSVEKIMVHSDYNAFNFKSSDIAILKVKGPIKMSKTVRPICLPEQSYEDVGSKTLFVSGWGYTNYSVKGAPKFLQTVKLNVLSLEKCSEIYGKIDYKIYRSQICTFNKNKDACQGDSGGPAIKIVNGVGVLVGIVSYGVKCAYIYPGVYTKVSFFLNWIQEQMQE